MASHRFAQKRLSNRDSDHQASLSNSAQLEHRRRVAEAARKALPLDSFEPSDYSPTSPSQGSHQDMQSTSPQPFRYGENKAWPKALPVKDVWDTDASGIDDTTMGFSASNGHENGMEHQAENDGSNSDAELDQRDVQPHQRHDRFAAGSFQLSSQDLDAIAEEKARNGLVHPKPHFPVLPNLDILSRPASQPQAKLDNPVSRFKVQKTAVWDAARAHNMSPVPRVQSASRPRSVYGQEIAAPMVQKVHQRQQQWPQRSFDDTSISHFDDDDDDDDDDEPEMAVDTDNMTTIPFPSASKHKRAPSLDYPADALESMKPDTLFSQSFDTNSKPSGSIFPASQLSLPLTEKLALLKHHTPQDRALFFSSLGITEWDESGDWILEQFGDLIKQMKDARKERRVVAAKFEEEIESRYREVETQSERIAGGLKKMKAGGGRVLAGEGS